MKAAHFFFKGYTFKHGNYFNFHNVNANPSVTASKLPCLFKPLDRVYFALASQVIHQKIFGFLGFQGLTLFPDMEYHLALY